MQTPTIKYREIVFSSINLIPIVTPKVSIVPFCCSPFHPESGTGILTRDSALLLLQLHPLIVWSPKNYCVLGRRVLHLVSPHLFGSDQLTVGFLPNATEEEVHQLMAAESLLNQIAFATTSGGKGIFATGRKTDLEIVRMVAPLLNSPVEKIAKLFSDCGLSTLNKLSNEHEFR